MSVTYSIYEAYHGAGRGGRTPTRLPSADFESAASASSAIPANPYKQLICRYLIRPCQAHIQRTGPTVSVLVQLRRLVQIQYRIGPAQLPTGVERLDERTATSPGSSYDPSIHEPCGYQHPPLRGESRTYAADHVNEDSGYQPPLMLVRTSL
jgi:hypothetical protein